jgi:hypothetical protein
MSNICSSCEGSGAKAYKDLRDPEIYEVDEQIRIWCKHCTDDDYTLI